MSPIATGWLATVCDVSRGTHHVINPSRPSPAFRTASDKSWVWRPGNEATCHCRAPTHLPCTCIHTGTIRRFLEHYGDEIDLVVFVNESSEVTCLKLLLPENELCMFILFLSHLPPHSPYISKFCRSTFLAMQKKRSMLPRLCQLTLVREDRGELSGQQ